MKEQKVRLSKKLMAVIISLAFVFTSIYVSDVEAEAYQNRTGNFSRSYSLSGGGADKIVSVALAQQGKSQRQLGYSEAWCADFVSDCAALAGVSSAVPADANCYNLYNKIRNAGGTAVSSPQKGDIIFYYCPRCSTHWAHVGIMVDSRNSVEGNLSGYSSAGPIVREVNWHYNDGHHTTESGIVQRKFLRPAYSGGSTASYDPDAGLSTSYAGNYYVNTSRYDLYLRSAQSTSSTILASIPKGTHVYVEKANGTWAKVTYNGKTGYCSMQYLAKVQYELPATYVEYWLSKSPMGDVINSAKSNELIYLCYRLKRQDNDQLVGTGNYNVKETVYNPDGSKYYSCDYQNNNNWIRFTTRAGGNYRCTIELTGDWTNSIEKTLYNVPDGTMVHTEGWFSNSSMGSKITKLEKGKSYYYCFKAVNKDDKYYNDSIAANSTANFSLKTPSGRSLINRTFSNTDHYAYAFTASETGTYSGTYSFKSDLFNGQAGTTNTIDSIDTTPKLSRIIVLKWPSKTTYYIGDRIDTTGLVIRAYYTDGSYKDVTNYTLDYNTSQTGNRQVNVKYTDNGVTRTNFFNITVKKKEDPKVTLSYNTQGGTMSGKPQTVSKGSYVTIPSEKPVKTITIHYDSNGGQKVADKKLNMPFRKWISHDENGKTYDPGDRIQLSKDIVLEADYDSADAGKLPVITRDGYTFDGWYTKYDTRAKDDVNINADQYLTAHWTKKADSDNSGDNTQITDGKTSGDGQNTNDDASNNNSGNDNDQNNQSVNNDDTSDEFDVDTEENSDEDDDSDSDAPEVGDEISTDDAVYTVTNAGDVLTVEYSDCEADTKKVIVPDSVTINGKAFTVTSIGEKAFANNRTITAVSIGKNITSIGTKSFYGCTKLKQLVVNSKNITTVKSKAFKKVPKSVKVLVPKSKYKIYKKMFRKAGISVKSKFKKIK